MGIQASERLRDKFFNYFKKEFKLESYQYFYTKNKFHLNESGKYKILKIQKREGHY